MNTAHGNIPNHLAWTIIATVIATFTCCPFGLIGIVGIVFASKVNNLIASGDLAGAQRASGNARTWAIVTSVLAAIGLLWVVYVMATGGPAFYQQMMEQIQAAQTP